MSAFVVKGWCPDAWRPMAAGDGLLVRVRPRAGRLSRDRMLALCRAAIRYGNGEIDATSRGNLQIRGVREQDWRMLVDTLLDHGLIDPDPEIEARAAILVAPDHAIGDDTHWIADALYERLRDLPMLPNKVGFAVDAGPAPMLREASADFRIERDRSGALILRADGRDHGMPVSREAAADRLIALAHWFVESGGVACGRMARHGAPLPAWAIGTALPAPMAARMIPGPHPLGLVVGLPFGRIAAEAVAAWLDGEPAITAIRVTPWRMLLCETDRPLSRPLDRDALIVDPAQPLLRIDACVGAPACPQASVTTRTLARQLAPYLGDHRLHVSGCAKGCARAAPADIVLTGRDGKFDLAFHSRAGGAPVHAGLDTAQILAHFGAA